MLDVIDQATESWSFLIVLAGFYSQVHFAYFLIWPVLWGLFSFVLFYARLIGVRRRWFLYSLITDVYSIHVHLFISHDVAVVMGAVWRCSRCALKPKSPSSKCTDLDGGHADRYNRCEIELSSDFGKGHMQHTRTTRKLLFYGSKALPDTTAIPEAQLAGTMGVSKAY